MSLRGHGSASLGLVCKSARLLSVRLVLISVISFALAPPGRCQPSAVEQLFVGNWTLSLTNAKCTESIEFRVDGTAHVVSGSEDSISGYAIAEIPQRPGDYAWFDWMLKNNGQPDCRGNLIPVGDKAVIYMLPFPTGGYELCRRADRADCIGVMRRAPGEGS